MTADTDASAGRPAIRRALFALVGTAQGGLLYLLHEYGESLIAVESIRTAVLVWLIFAPPLFLFADQAGRRWPAGLFAGGTALLFALLYRSVDARYVGEPPRDEVEFLAPAIAGIAIVALPFFRCWGETGRPRFSYPRLFQHAWNTLHIFVGAWVFTGAVWLVLSLWGLLFELIDVDFFSELFHEAWFALPATGLAFGLAVAILRDWARVVGAVRGVVLALLRMLTPVVAAAVALFVLFLPFTGLAPLWSRGSPTAILLSAFAIAVLLVNSVIEDADGTATGNKVLNIAAMALVVLLPVLAALAGISAGLRITQYGLTPERAYGAILIAMAGLYALAYLWSLAVRRRGWTEGIRSLNIRLAAVAAVVAAAVCTPALDVQRMSADNQVGRLLSGRVSVDQFDFHFLNYGLGHAGAAALVRLRGAEDHPQHAAIVAAIDAAQESGPCIGCAAEGAEIAAAQAIIDSPTVRILPDGIELPDGLRRHLVDSYRWRVNLCHSESEAPACYVIVADLIGDPIPEAVFIDRSHGEVVLFKRKGDDWEISRTRYLSTSDEHRRRLFDALDAGEMAIVTPSHRTVRAGGVELPITP